ncbi:hypothetical protein LZ554_001581 [Drepanopeziza brunnea f. sp. 'monogermtubi']|nr:hypothetical protein LZ554_001581 [Drepanopeziza brunnea f. sp. 'monogermtubi']
MILIAALVCGLYFGLGHSRSIPRQAGSGLTVDLGYSRYVGVDAGSGVTQWLGIRYAQPPVGDLKFRAPQDPLPDGQTHTANEHGAICHFSPSTSLDPNRSEDCLFLDVYAPSTGTTGKHPVFVFFQGGGFNGLSVPNLNGVSLINAGNRDMVIVTFNYRVGPWGFLASKEVRANGNLNNGLLDQRKVLEWIQKYIHLFGGDPGHVTMGGGSAGAAAVLMHMSAYGGRNDNLFHAAAAGSQSFGAELTVEESQYQYDALVRRVGCSTSPDTLSCLRNVPVRTLASNNPDIPTPNGGGGNAAFMWNPCVDGGFLQGTLYSLFAQGKYVKVPSIFGDTTNEGTIFTPASIATAAARNTFLSNNFPKLTPAHRAQIDSLYPRAEQYPGKGEFWKSAANAYGEMRYSCPSIYLSRLIAAADTPSWNFRWDVLSPANARSGLGVTHSADGAATWGYASAPDNALTPLMQAYWTSFIRTYNPNTHKLSTAPVWAGAGAVYLQRLHIPNQPSAVGMTMPPEDLLARCKYLTSIGGSIGQ